jgi:hypothetical protein
MVPSPPRFEHLFTQTFEPSMDNPNRLTMLEAKVLGMFKDPKKPDFLLTEKTKPLTSTRFYSLQPKESGTFISNEV